MKKLKTNLPKQYQWYGSAAIPDVSATFLHTAISVTSLLAVHRTPKKTREGKMTCQANHTGEQAILQVAEEASISENPFIFGAVDCYDDLLTSCNTLPSLLTCLLDVGAFLGPNMKTQKVREVEHHSCAFITGFSSVPVHLWISMLERPFALSHNRASGGKLCTVRDL